jgi:hypothetical protein
MQLWTALCVSVANRCNLLFFPPFFADRPSAFGLMVLIYWKRLEALNGGEKRLVKASKAQSPPQPFLPCILLVRRRRRLILLRLVFPDCLHLHICDHIAP